MSEITISDGTWCCQACALAAASANYCDPELIEGTGVDVSTVSCIECGDRTREECHSCGEAVCWDCMKTAHQCYVPTA